MRNVVRFNALGVPAMGVTLTAPVGNCTDSATLFCDQLIGGTSPTQSFELTNNTAAEISGIATSFLAGDTGDFTVASSSCGTTLAANSNCFHHPVKHFAVVDLHHITAARNTERFDGVCRHHAHLGIGSRR